MGQAGLDNLFTNLASMLEYRLKNGVEVDPEIKVMGFPIERRYDDEAKEWYYFVGYAPPFVYAEVDDGTYGTLYGFRIYDSDLSNIRFE